MERKTPYYIAFFLFVIAISGIIVLVSDDDGDPTIKENSNIAQNNEIFEQNSKTHEKHDHQAHNRENHNHGIDNKIEIDKTNNKVNEDSINNETVKGKAVNQDAQSQTNSMPIPPQNLHANHQPNTSPTSQPSKQNSPPAPKFREELEKQEEKLTDTNPDHQGIEEQKLPQAPNNSSQATSKDEDQELHNQNAEHFKPIPLDIPELKFMNPEFKVDSKILYQEE